MKFNTRFRAVSVFLVLASIVDQRACFSSPADIDRMAIAQASNCFRLTYGGYASGQSNPEICQEPPPLALKSMAGFVRPNTSILDAVNKGCRDQSDLSDIYENALQFIDPANSVTINSLRSKRSAILSEGRTTKYYVTAPGTYLYRGLTIARELDWILSTRITYSKYLNAVINSSKNKSIAGDRIAQIGPYVLPDGWGRNNHPPDENLRINHTPISLALQILATKSTNEPSSQFSSYALRRETTLDYQLDGYAYFFALNPQSPVLGLVGCDLNQSASNIGGGETQLQVPGGTYIQELQRVKQNTNDYEVYDWDAKVWKRPLRQHW